MIVKINTMKKLVVSLLVLLSISCFAQDEIYFADGKLEEGKVLEVDRGYLVIRNAEGVKYKIERIEIAMVIYENGSFEIYNKNYEARSKKSIEASKKPEPNQPVVKDLGVSNQLKLNLTSFAFGTAELSYQRHLTGLLAIEIPIAYGWEDGLETYYLRKKYSFGLNLLFYPLKPESNFQLFVGPGFEGGNAYVSDDLYEDFYYFEPVGGGGGYYGPSRLLKGFYSNYMNIGIRLGVSHKVTEAFGFGVEGGVGLKSFVGPNNFIMPFANFNFNLQYYF